MITRPVARLLIVSIARNIPLVFPIPRHFSSTKANKEKNRIYNPVRRPDDFQSYLLMSTSSRNPLLTYYTNWAVSSKQTPQPHNLKPAFVTQPLTPTQWTASYCNTCRTVAPLIHDLIESGVGEEEGGVSFCEVEYDAPDIMSSGFGMTYMITSMPTLLSFDRGEAQTDTKLVDPRKLRDTAFMKEWIRNEARRRGGGSGGNGVPASGAGLFGGLFGSSK
ncbi:hypothetical protein HYALB_00011240 [Hymenoscyphus albidus]|uniref:Thioredoxin domain-containing protein n=1 Tax=Hymenoscyphus albidus TaxID=595503 RepID=A0A9N9LE72_9HELO|nr:hypothetical protein HYALB_00011240 [Hymenoscyphus albidus]